MAFVFVSVLGNVSNSYLYTSVLFFINLISWQLNIIKLNLMEIVGVVSSYKANGNNSLALTIPKILQEKLGIKRGTQFIVRLDEKGRIVYEQKP